MARLDRLDTRLDKKIRSQRLLTIEGRVSIPSNLSNLSNLFRKIIGHTTTIGVF